MQLERELCRIPEVTAARIVTGRAGEVVEVHILATPNKQPKQVVRDVQSVAMAAYGLDVDRRVISVVLLDTPGFAPGLANGHGPAGSLDEAAAAVVGDDAATRAAPAAGDAESRVRVEGVAYARNGYRCSIEVSLQLGETRALGTAEGSAAAAAGPRLVAAATLDALGQLYPSAGRADVESAVVGAVGERRVATANLVLVGSPDEEVLVGSAIVRGAGDHDAMARAVLDAANRRLLRTV